MLPPGLNKGLNRGIFIIHSKIFPCFWLVKTTNIIHHNQLLLTKFGKNFVMHETMTSKWCQKCSLVAGYWTSDQENLGTRLSCFGSWNKMVQLSWNISLVSLTAKYCLKTLQNSVKMNFTVNFCDKGFVWNNFLNISFFVTLNKL